MGYLISKIFYSPVKSISFDNVNSIGVKKSIGFENDRIFSFSRNIDLNGSKLIERDPYKRSLHKFLTLRNSPFLNKYNFSLISRCRNMVRISFSFFGSALSFPEDVFSRCCTERNEVSILEM